MLENLQAILISKPGFDFFHDGRYGPAARTAVKAFLNRGLELLESGIFRMTVRRAAIRGRALLDGAGSGSPRLAPFMYTQNVGRGLGGMCCCGLHGSRSHSTPDRPCSLFRRSVSVLKL